PPTDQPTVAGQEPDIPAMEGGTRLYNTPPGYPGYGTPSGGITPPYTPPGTPPYIPPGTPPGTPYPPYQTPGGQWVYTPPEGILTPTGEHAQVPSAPWRWITTIVAIVAVATTIISVAAIVFLSGGGDKPDVQPTASHPAAVATEFQPELVTAVESGETMVLVAKLEQLSGIEQLSGMRPRDVSRFIVDDLQQRLQTVAPFSSIRVRAYPQVITTEAQAMAVAEANGAAVIIWGNYNSSTVELEVQIGTLTAYPHNPFSRDTLEQTANVRVHMRDERQESAAPYVLGVLDVLNIADGGGFETMRTRAVLDAIGTVDPGEIPENSVAAYTHRAFQVVLNDPAQAVEILDSGLQLAPGNPILYVERGAANQRQSMMDDAKRDLETARRLGPEHWTMPQLLLSTMSDNLNEVFDLFDEIITERPDDWFPLFFRGAIYYQSGAYDIAQDNIEQAIALAPDANFPYIYGALLAMHQGRLDDAGTMIRTILEDYPDPDFMNRLIAAFFGSNALSSYGYKLSAFGNMVLGRYDAVMEATDSGLEYFSRDVDLYVIQGFAECALGDYAKAERSYTSAIGLEPDFTLIYLLRAEVRRKQRNFTTAAADLQSATQSIHGQEFLPLSEAVRQGTVGCGNFFSLNNPLLSQAATAEPGGG
ncbi:MAG TPA: tetratricopeptide repeat protein, partial [Aggregatilinea sp.]|uniref:tetratricopeptide repeat protein n=1 Tax=Aggregatilinea sp. TaxID=2806333 RepID=UPI002CA97C13